MGSSRVSSNTPDWRDVHRAAHQLQVEYQVSVAVVLRPIGTMHGALFAVVAMAWIAPGQIGVASPLASASRTLGGVGATDTNAAALAALYSLESELLEKGLVPYKTQA